MSDVKQTENKRRHPRVAINKRVVGCNDFASMECSLMDISAGGAAIESDMEFEDDFEIDLDIEDFGLYSSHVTRSFDDGFAVCFDIDEDEQDKLIMEIERIRETIDDENY